MTQKPQNSYTDNPWHEPMSRALDVHRWSDYPELNQCLAVLATEIEGIEGRQRRRNDESQKRFKDAIRSIVLDLYVAWNAGPTSVVGVALGKDKFRRDSRYRALFLTYDTFIAAFDGLVGLGYVSRVNKGYNYGPGAQARVTRVRATEKLIELLTGPAGLTVARLTYRTGPDAPEPIILRNKKKKSVGYTDTNYTITIRDEVERINDKLSGHSIDLRISDEQMTDLNSRMASDFSDKRRTRFNVDFAAKRLRRIFNNEDWAQGGRFYGGWWQNVPKDYRRYITIDDKRTVEVDYSEMHPLMMYASVNAKLEGDAYDVGLPKVPRDTIKLAFNKLVNAERHMNPEQDLAQYGTTSDELRARIRDRHRPIDLFFKSGHGSRLQNLDADLAARVMIRFLDMGYVCLPVHDSFIVHHGLEDDLGQIMVTEFKDMFGVDPGTKTKRGIGMTLLPGLVDMNIDDMLSPTGEYSGYETRLSNWWVARSNLSGR